MLIGAAIALPGLALVAAEEMSAGNRGLGLLFAAVLIIIVLGWGRLFRLLLRPGPALVVDEARVRSDVLDVAVEWPEIQGAESRTFPLPNVPFRWWVPYLTVTREAKACWVAERGLFLRLMVRVDPQRFREHFLVLPGFLECHPRTLTAWLDREAKKRGRGR